MNFVLDTNAVSETEKPRPNPGYVAWRDAQDRAHLFVTTITLAEIWQGFHNLEPNHPMATPRRGSATRIRFAEREF